MHQSVTVRQFHARACRRSPPRRTVLGRAALGLCRLSAALPQSFCGPRNLSSSYIGSVVGTHTHVYVAACAYTKGQLISKANYLVLI